MCETKSDTQHLGELIDVNGFIIYSHAIGDVGSRYRARAPFRQLPRIDLNGVKQKGRESGTSETRLVRKR